MLASFLLRYQDQLKDAATSSSGTGGSGEEYERQVQNQTVTEIQGEGPRKDPKRRSYSALPDLGGW